MFDINGGEALILLVIAVLVGGPERLPKYAEQLGQLVRRARVFLQDTRTRVDEELGDDLKDVDWAALDPRRYDPRRIVRDALFDDITPAPPAAQARSAGATPESIAAAAAGAEARRVKREGAATGGGPAGGPGAATGVPHDGPSRAPFDDDAT